MKTNKTIGYAVIEAIALILACSMFCMFMTSVVLIKCSTDIFLDENYVEFFSAYLEQNLPEHIDSSTIIDSPVTTDIPLKDTLQPIEDKVITTDIPITTVIPTT